jgi:hypothetical protein
VWIVLGEGIEGILNPELSAATINQVAQRIHAPSLIAPSALQRLIKLIKFQQTF